MLKVTLYGKQDCKYCNFAKNLLNDKSIEYSYIELDTNQSKNANTKYITKDELLTIFPNARTLPQIIINDRHIGGYTDLEKFMRENNI